MYTYNAALVVVGITLFGGGVGLAEESIGYGVGRPATVAEVQAWDIDITPTGAGLPPGRGTVIQGATVYAAKCASCHGPTGIEGPQNRLVGGHGSLDSEHPVKTIGSFWPYATTLYDYIRRAMPWNAPQSLTPDEVYAVVAWLLHQNGIVPADAVMDAGTLPAVTMPNRDGFISDPRPDMPVVDRIMPSTPLSSSLIIHAVGHVQYQVIQQRMPLVAEQIEMEKRRIISIPVQQRSIHADGMVIELPVPGVEVNAVECAQGPKMSHLIFMGLEEAWVADAERTCENCLADR